MRLKALIRYQFSTIKSPVLIFLCFYMGGVLLGAFISAIASINALGVRDMETGRVWSSSIMAFSIFMLVNSLICSQKETRFLITRSVSRKEIFLSNALFFLPFAACMAALQMLTVLIDGGVRVLLGGGDYRGLTLDIQSLMAPNLKNAFVFFAVSFSLLLLSGCLSYLLGSCMARWKVPTVGVLAVGGVALIACMVVPEVFSKIFDALKFMFFDAENGLWIALKNLLLCVPVMGLAYLVMRRIIAAKQTA